MAALPGIGDQVRGVALHCADALDGRAQIRVESSGGRAHVAERGFKGGFEGSLSPMGVWQGGRGAGRKGVDLGVGDEGWKIEIFQTDTLKEIRTAIETSWQSNLHVSKSQGSTLVNRESERTMSSSVPSKSGSGDDDTSSLSPTT